MQGALQKKQLRASFVEQFKENPDIEYASTSSKRGASCSMSALHDYVKATRNCYEGSNC